MLIEMTVTLRIRFKHIIVVQCSVVKNIDSEISVTLSIPTYWMDDRMDGLSCSYLLHTNPHSLVSVAPGKYCWCYRVCAYFA